MADLTEQQGHLQSILTQQRDLATEINSLQAQINSKKELFNKTQGVVEYLTQLGVELPKEEEKPAEETKAEVVK